MTRPIGDDGMKHESGAATKPHIRKLRKLRACKEAVEWADGYPSMKAAWDVCERGDWLLWYAAMVGAPRKKLVLAACDCAATALKYAGENRKVAERCLRTTRAWARGKATIEQVGAAVAAAVAATFLCGESVDAAAVYAAAAAAAAYTAAYAAAPAYAAAAAVYAAAARNKARKRHAAIVRKYFPTPPRGRK